MKTIWVVLITFVVSALAIGGGTYYFTNANAKIDKDNLQSQITELNNKITVAEKKLADAEATAETSSTTTDNKTETWKTYTNPRVNYSFEYPASGLKLDLDETIKYPSTSNSNPKTEDLVQFASSDTTYSVRADVSGHASTVEAWITGGSESPSAEALPSKNLSDYDKVTISGATAYTSKTSLITYAVVGTKYYTIAAYNNISLKTGTDATYSHLLSSFVFTK